MYACEKETFNWLDFVLSLTLWLVKTLFAVYVMFMYSTYTLLAQNIQYFTGLIGEHSDKMLRL